jgi:hypothetical protein
LQSIPKTLFTNKANPSWSKLKDEELMELRLKDIALPLEKTGIPPFIDRLYDELENKGILQFKPHVWLSEEWFTPDGLGGIAIPFFLSHRRLAHLEEQNLYEVEGGTPRWFMQLLRHECGHAIDNAFRLRRRRKRQQLFGKSTTPYEDYYSPKPYSKKYVVHLDTWYAQSHPDEDFAETFAVWLNPRSSWAKRYQRWPGALKKLKYMDELMGEIGAEKPKIRSKELEAPLNKIRKSIGEHYEQKRTYYGLDYPEVYDVHLFKLFSNHKDYSANMKATQFIKKVRKEARRAVVPWTGSYQYTINQLLEEILVRSQELGLRLRLPFEESKNQFISLLSVITLEYLHSGNYRIPR